MRGRIHHRRRAMQWPKGNLIGSLNVLEIQKGKRRGFVAVCRCSCGRRVAVPLSRLLKKTGVKRSCGRRECDRRFQNPDGPGSRIHRGYRYICVKRKWVAEHRLVMEEALGRPLASTEHVHHRNGDRLDNNIANLECLSVAAHSKSHAAILKELFELKEENRWLRKCSAAHDNSTTKS